MTGGFALLAYPAEHGSSGVMTFIVSPQGVVYQKNRGAKTRGGREGDHHLRSRRLLDAGPGLDFLASAGDDDGASSVDAGNRRAADDLRAEAARRDRRLDRRTPADGLSGAGDRARAPARNDGRENYWQVYFDTNHAIRETFASAGYPSPEQLVLVRSGT